jgi:hypothetical protein
MDAFLFQAEMLLEAARGIKDLGSSSKTES